MSTEQERETALDATDTPKKRKIALYVAYIGAGYQGMQANPGQKTIESTLEAAIHRAGGISKDNAGSFSKVKWMRSARTDKGVSAVGQVVSLKMLVGDQHLVQKINQELPAEIRVFGFTQVTGSFDARLLCDRRRYEYILPAYAVTQRSDPKEAEHQAATPTPPETPAEQSAAIGEVCTFDEDARSRLNKILSQYEGTHRFHNFTVKVAASDSSSRRYILSFQCPGLLHINGRPWVKLVVTGQSFMLHQIRKMVGLAVAVVRGVAPETAIAHALDPRHRFNTPIAPDVGLFLDESIFDSYNQRWSDRGMQVGLTDYEAQIKSFKDELLYPHIVERDDRESCMRLWLEQLEGMRQQLKVSIDKCEGLATDAQEEQEPGSVEAPDSKRMKA